MKPDDELCLCFHVTMRKVQNFCRIEKPRRASQLSECGGAGTGCGWCRPFLQRIFENQQQTGESEIPDSEAYHRDRAAYLEERKKRGDKTD
ncbi:(2Fe-2S)-binding protein [Bremerella cremea]|uniref:(2Fe-2S)-binding protein n=1 Tax=Blastopirellula marina TaxID=124 RepID=A0A2S8FJ95_9BACT|nr:MULTISPECIES: (2Fe-2S)-binding protein [Pirellulaceae]PQO31994.1 (2Fe-2S)-binding protein [Blastopirellula marina]RCS45061.1 (2Fe-2S)-binding protein [Bremerella cremea]